MRLKDRIVIVRILRDYKVKSLYDLNHVGWTFICKNCQLDDNFLEKYFDYLDFYYIYKKCKLSAKFVLKYATVIDIPFILQYQKHLPDKFINKLARKFMMSD